MEIWVIGNGESRRKFPLNSIRSLSIGCNAIHRNYICDIFVAVDRKMVNEILSNPNCKNKPIYTRPEWFKEFASKQVLELPSIPYTGSKKPDQGLHWNSGPYAILLAALKNPEYINLLGFDLYGVNGLQNNVYKDSDNYAPSSQKEIKPTFWIYQISKLLELYPKIKFVQYQHKDWQTPQEWSVYKNLTVKYFPV